MRVGPHPHALSLRRSKTHYPRSGPQALLPPRGPSESQRFQVVVAGLQTRERYLGHIMLDEVVPDSRELRLGEYPLKVDDPFPHLGEVLRGGGTSSKLDVTTELQSFGLIVTAEPYFAVSHPSDVVVMENVLRKDTAGGVEPIEAK